MRNKNPRSTHQGGLSKKIKDTKPRRNYWGKAILNADILSVNSWKECLNFNPNPYGCGLWQFDNGWFGHDGGLPGLRHWQRLNFKDKVAIIILSNVVMEEPPFLAQLMEYLIR